ncbi:hypothetical protein [Anaerolentibacter hominis]|uniref:hypothetical protein n=1 Tax=Anaerolentibacter hominis TaxID=3079009 RepID=UPI0031B85B23
MDTEKLLVRFLNSTGWSDKLNRLFIGERDKQSRFLKGLVRRWIIIVTAVAGLLTVIGIRTSADQSWKLTSLSRPGMGMGCTTVSFTAVLKEKDQMIRTPVTVELEEREYTDEEVRKFLDNGVSYLEQELLGENPSAGRITDPLNIMEQIPGTPVSVRWEMDPGGYLSGDGSIRKEQIPETGVKITAAARLECQGRNRVRVFELFLLPEVRTEEEILAGNLREKILRLQDENRDQDQIALPDTLNQYQVSYEAEDRQPVLPQLMTAGILMIPISGYCLLRTIDEGLKKKEKELKNAYPEFIDLFVLLFGTGLSVRNIWQRIMLEYEKNKERQFLYQEMFASWNEIERGSSFEKAIENFGRRCGIQSYIKFSYLLSQNLKKGTRELLDMLDYERKESISERQEEVRKKGEEASTKLLIPMTMMLFIVLMIIMIPAFTTI